MSYILFHLPSGVALRCYRTEATARSVMRHYNRQAGWARLSRCWSGGVEMEWCAKLNGDSVYKHGPYAICHKTTFEEYIRDAVCVVE